MSGPREVTLRRRSWEPDSTITVTLDQQHGQDEWQVTYQGQLLGTVDRYRGSLDRPLHRGSRIRREGKRRILWGDRPPGGRRWTGGHYSRADAIRRLIADAEHDGLVERR